MPEMTCPVCNGTGSKQLTGEYADTLAMVRRSLRRRDYVTGAMLFDKADCGRTAMANRLARLEEMGFLESEQYGRERRFRVKSE